jgi:outer membrane receptor protein involved in Fe transport
VGGDVRYLRIRGLHQNLSTITQDGNRLADAAFAGATRKFQFQTVDSDSIERIEVTKSPTPDMDGDSIGGAVNLVSKSAFDSSPARRISSSVGAIWRPSTWVGPLTEVEIARCAIEEFGRRQHRSGDTRDSRSPL